jgi:hypothetical protein
VASREIPEISSEAKTDASQVKGIIAAAAGALTITAYRTGHLAPPDDVDLNVIHQIYVWVSNCYGNASTARDNSSVINPPRLTPSQAIGDAP